ncbi:MAG: DNA mismatch repair endonuclease MutL [Sodalis sp. (in: enterobacteria)]|uniref:DNA mismatch repair endonuclease MutL n=1 Tax=Sodalis sp. (in: enterobacteria) TaxID=1898979 RepID=UPI0039E243A5
MQIQVLPPQLANQIAAGEVVERPASVVKELLENSLDAGATRIEIDIERGGAKRIRINDNGSGIVKEELELALARHATSKIASLDDLESITSMGFRGEALASVSSVSRLTLTSRTAAQSEAWQAYAEGRELAVTLKPAAHPVGTTVDVVDLFYNTPARRKFMRTEKTEFTHIDEVIRRIALARFDVTFILQHNAKTVRQYRAVSQQSQHLRRLGGLCGPAFVEQALGVSWQHGDLAIHGWVADPAGGELPEIQYSYVNRRTMRDKLINHAIRQAYQDQLAGTQQPAFVLFLDVDPHQVDVNVHPAKHEVRFHQARLVHDFIYQAVVTVLQQSAAPRLPIGDEGAGPSAPENRQASGRNHFSLPAGEASSLWGAQQPDGEPSPLREDAAVSGQTAARPVVVAGAEGRRAASETGGDSEHDRRSAAAGGDSVLDRGSAAIGDERVSPHQPSVAAGRGGQARERSAGYQRKEGVLYRQLVQTAPLPQEGQTAPRDIFARPRPADGGSLPGDNGPPHAGAASSSFAVMGEASVSTGPAVAGNPHSFGRVLTLVAPCYALVESTSSLALLSLPVAERGLTERQLTPGTEQLRAQPLLIPLRMTLRDEEAAALKRHQPLLQEIGIALQAHLHQAILNAVPLPLRQQNLQNLIPDLLGYLHGKTSVTHHQVAVWLARRLQHESVVWSHSRAIQLLAKVERLCPQWVKAPPDGLLVTLNFEAAIKALNHD